VVKAIFARCTASLLLDDLPAPPRGVRFPDTGPLGGPVAEGPHDGADGGTGMVGCRTPDHPRIHGCGQPTVVSPGLGDRPSPQRSRPGNLTP